MAKIESISAFVCLALLACGDDASEPGPELAPDSGTSVPKDAGPGGSKPDAAAPPPVVDGASKPPDSGTTQPAPDAGGIAKPDAGAPPTGSTIQDPNSLVSGCVGTSCPAGKCGISESCDGLYDDALSGSYDFCPPGVSDKYCLVTCSIDAFNADCDLTKAEKYRLIDCSGGKPAIVECGPGQGCATAGNGAVCSKG